MSCNESHSLTQVLIELYEKLSSWEHSVVKDTELSVTQFHTIEILGTEKNVKMKALAQKMGITTGTLTVMIDKLEKKNLVKRIQPENDRRSYIIELTKKGEEYYKSHYNMHNKLTHEMTSSMSEKESEQLVKLINKLLENF